MSIQGSYSAPLVNPFPMETLRLWTGGTDTSVPDFSTPIGGNAPVTTSLDSPIPFLPSSSSLRNAVPSWVPFVGNVDTSQPENECFPSLSWTQRVIGFVVLLLVGILFCAFEISSLVRRENFPTKFLSAMVLVSPRSFAKFYTLGNLFIIGSTFFLMGPRRQLANMFDKTRFTAALIYFASTAGTLFSAIGVGSTLLTLVMVIIQLCASVWYGSSYVPFAQSLIKSTASTILPL